MAITEKSRHELYRRLEEILGPDEATTLMEHLPPVGWADVATKDDLRSLETRLDARISVLGSELRTEMANLSAELNSSLRTNTFLLVGAMGAIGGLFTAVASLT
ncbi:hypothetical protein [Actinomarinicola tropica]|uniref:DUF1640 domain-containing protein n=1 Tax=Actinomarinicola tropica TaxID=2789776 RepID=A0A5Q2RBS6_9ACTN|nr:hypothetical protein [Actinomarinicola tropica]QGG94329.1 hypothetical protein GH723_04000 [Actinomarinicola tropica]